MIRLCFQYLAIYSNLNLPKSIQIVSKWVENFAQNQMNLKYIAKVVEFCQIWSHCRISKKPISKSEQELLQEIGIQLENISPS